MSAPSSHAQSHPAEGAAGEATAVAPFKAVYHHLDTCLAGIAALQKAGIKGFTVLSPMPRHEIDELI